MQYQAVYSHTTSRDTVNATLFTFRSHWIVLVFCGKIWLVLAGFSNYVLLIWETLWRRFHRQLTCQWADRAISWRPGSTALVTAAVIVAVKASVSKVELGCVTVSGGTTFAVEVEGSERALLGRPREVMPYELLREDSFPESIIIILSNKEDLRNVPLGKTRGRR